MRYLLGAVFLASCTALTPSPTDNTSTIEPHLPAATPPVFESEQEIRKPKPKASPPPAPEISSCANLKMADLKETIRAKLDCISENAK
ncbi:MAG TPA: hypothetical protein VGP12_10865 [Nitrosospira sp.]|jgi:hypothetical protein|nr:hypothetical protein [Nitrosospira sp.]